VPVKTFFPRLETSQKFEPSPHPQPKERLVKKAIELAPLYADQAKNLNPHPLPKVIPEQIIVTALNGHKISRCQHGSYWTERFGPVYCETCCPGTSLRMIGEQESPLKWEMSLQFHESHTRTEPFADSSRKVPASQCPKCRCNIHIVRLDGKWECPECGHVWRGRPEATNADAA
jgi:predicted RNA-binding Zn-ribbon protein involved in translation (DUF1610 family)